MPIRQTTCLLPYAHLNLRRNPFGEFSEAERTALAHVTVDPILLRLSDPHYAVQFVGEKGYGKTTHLLTIRCRFPDSGYVHIAEGERAAIPSGRPVLVDEAQRLTRWQQFRLFRPGTPLVLGTHRDFSKELRRAGRVVETVEVGQGTSVERLHQLLNARIAWVRREDGPLPWIKRETADSLRQEFGPDIRGVLHELYGVFQNLKNVTDV